MGYPSRYDAMHGIKLSRFIRSRCSPVPSILRSTVISEYIVDAFSAFAGIPHPVQPQENIVGGKHAGKENRNDEMVVCLLLCDKYNWE